MAHDGPDPIMHWRFDQHSIKDGEIVARLGRNAKFEGRIKAIKDDFGGSIYFSGGSCVGVITDDVASMIEEMPSQDITISVWVSIDESHESGGIIGVAQDNGDFEKGWALGFDETSFTFALASQKADDGDGKLTYLRGKTRYEKGKLYHVVATYDGELMQLYVNGKLDAESTEQSGKILYPEHGPFVLAAYKDDNEHYPLRGNLREISVYDLVAKPTWVEHEFGHGKELLTLAPNGMQSGDVSFIVKPFLQYGTQDSMTVVWRTSKPTIGTLFYGENDNCDLEVKESEPKLIHTIHIPNLTPETQYFYFTSSTAPEIGFVESEIRTFATAVNEETPFAFAVIGDTQGNPTVAAALCKLAWAHRPSFAIHAGDLVDAGKRDTDWTEQFFPSMDELISRVAIYPVLGNHEQNAANYFDYLALPDPEYYYDFRYGKAHFFMIDTNRNVDPESEQFKWLDKNLSETDAMWKFVCHHHPPYSSDENDYGNLWKTNKSTRGDVRVRQLVKLYEKHNVDIVWSGHIHSYERTWPVFENKATDAVGPTYIITGGGGGNLETAGPVRPFFQNNIKRDHHFVMVFINGSQLEFKAFDLEGNLFDTFAVRK